jgi:hypothetical protein
MGQDGRARTAWLKMAWQAEIAFIWPELAFICLWVDCERTGLVCPGMALVGHRQDWLQLVVVGRNGQLEWTGMARTGDQLGLL